MPHVMWWRIFPSPSGWARSLFALIGVGFATSLLAAADPVAPLPPQMDYAPLAPSTYRLERIQRAPVATLIDASSRKVRLTQLVTGKVTLLTFFTRTAPTPGAARMPIA